MSQIYADMTELHLQLADVSCGLYHGLPPWFSMHFKSIATFLAKSANEKNLFSRRMVAFAECELSVDHITITPAIQWRRLGAGMRRLASAGPQLQHERSGAYWQTKALQTSRLSPNSHLFPNRATTAKRRPAVLSTVRKVWMTRSTGAGARKLFERIVRRRRDTQRPIDRPRGTVARPASGHSCRPTSLQWRTRRSALKSSLPVDPLAVVSAAACMQQPAEIGLGLARLAAAHVRIDEHAIRAPGPAVAVFEIWYLRMRENFPKRMAHSWWWQDSHLQSQSESFFFISFLCQTRSSLCLFFLNPADHIRKSKSGACLRRKR